MENKLREYQKIAHECEINNAAQATLLESEFKIASNDIVNPLGIYASLRVEPHYKTKPTGIVPFIDMYASKMTQ